MSESCVSHVPHMSESLWVSRYEWVVMSESQHRSRHDFSYGWHNFWINAIQFAHIPHTGRLFFFENEWPLVLGHRHTLYLSLSFSFGFSCACPHTLARANAHSHTQTQTHTYTHTNIHTNTYTNTHSLSLSFSLTHTLALSLTHTHTRTHTHTLTSQLLIFLTTNKAHVSHMRACHIHR